MSFGLSILKKYNTQYEGVEQTNYQSGLVHTHKSKGAQYSKKANKHESDTSPEESNTGIWSPAGLSEANCAQKEDGYKTDQIKYQTSGNHDFLNGFHPKSIVVIIDINPPITAANSFWLFSWFWIVAKSSRTSFILGSRYSTISRKVTP